MPSLYDSCIRYCMPVYPSAIQAKACPTAVLYGIMTAAVYSRLCGSVFVDSSIPLSSRA